MQAENQVNEEGPAWDASLSPDKQGREGKQGEKCKLKNQATYLTRMICYN